MSWSINTAWRDSKSGLTYAAASLICLAGICTAQVGEVRAPSAAVAGNSISLSTTGSGSATFYFIGPGVSGKRGVKLGEDIQIPAKELRYAGSYLGIICEDSCQSVEFFVNASSPSRLAFLVHPSRAPVAESDAISGVVLPFDSNGNLILSPTPTDFELTAAGATVMSRRDSTQDGIAWFRANSGRSAGALQVSASVNAVQSRRIVQQVASDPCNLRISGQRAAKGIIVETAPVRDCAGNPLPDGTIVTFTARDGEGKSTVDAPIKKGIARAEISAAGPIVVSAASGVVMGNDLRIQ
ncbi:MAG TPA: hypothetical protein VMG31_02855 [Verrucomicrobiae bacterium]|nr:hypothetical protein [Verrucomicrobiae bacterium]